MAELGLQDRLLTALYNFPAFSQFSCKYVFSLLVLQNLLHPHFIKGLMVFLIKYQYWQKQTWRAAEYEHFHNLYQPTLKRTSLNCASSRLHQHTLLHSILRSRHPSAYIVAPLICPVHLIEFFWILSFTVFQYYVTNWIENANLSSLHLPIKHVTNY